MRTQQNKNTKVTLLYEFAQNSRKPESISFKKTTQQKQQQSHPSFGLSTLLHFNNNSTISQVKSKQSYIFNSTITNQYQNIFADQTKKEIEALRNRRLELQEKWNQKLKDKYSSLSQPQHNYNQNHQLSSVLDSSEVENFNWNDEKTIYPRKPLEPICQDKLVIHLKEQIKKRQIKIFINRIKKIFLLQFTKEMRVFTKIIEFRKQQDKMLLHLIFQQWKDQWLKSEERQHLRKLIIQKIKKRKRIQEINQSIQLDPIIL